MIIFFPVGQLGNQIFQYAYLDGIRKPKELILSSDCEYFDVFEANKKNYLFINKYLRFFVRRLLGLLARLGVITWIKQTQYRDEEGNEIFESDVKIREGFFKNIRLVEGFFQSEVFVSDRKPFIRKDHLKNAEHFLSRIPSGAKKTAVHIRRGDYLTWSILGKENPSLPNEYYEKIIAEEAIKNPESYFVFLSNDVEFVENTFSNLKNKIVSKNSVATDFAIMALCDSAILSNSTLAWWAGQFMNTNAVIYAPRYWLGWKSNRWYPEGIETKKFKYVDVL